MTKILAVIDPEDTQHLALERCRQMTPDIDLDIVAVLFIKNDSAGNIASKFKDQSSWLTEQVTPYIADGYKVAAQVVPFTNLYEAVIETAEKHAADFVVKPMRQHSLFETALRTSTDWNLIRHCPFPVLLVSDLDKTRNKPVLAALDVCTGDENHEKLNETVFSRAQRLAGVLGSETHVVNAYRTVTPMAAVGSIDATPYPTASDLQRQHNDAVAEFIGDNVVSSCLVKEGAAPIVINEVAREIDAGVIVMGTVARKGIRGALIGNTAEGVLEGTRCDVLVVKL